MLMTLGVLVTGVALMMKGGAANKKYSNKLMVARVGLQGLTLLVIGVLFFIGK
jgi:hypothetical protein